MMACTASLMLRLGIPLQQCVVSEHLRTNVESKLFVL